MDTSAVLAILFGEEDARRYAEALASASHCRMSAANYLEAAIVLEGRRSTSVGFELDLVMERTPIELVPVTVEQAQIARMAWRRFGKGNHPAGLNFGDCFAYALAESTGAPLLFKGGDFVLTDIEAA